MMLIRAFIRKPVFKNGGMEVPRHLVLFALYSKFA